MKKYPFKFLSAYDQQDTDIFFGRDEEVKALYEMVSQNSMLLVYGASGTGKTSLIQCGLSGKFKSYDWLPVTVRRGSNINESLEKALTDAAGGNELMAGTEKKTTGFTQLVKAVYLNHFKPLYIIFDQFEELYILGTKDEEQQFIDAVQEMMAAQQPVKLIFSIREEYLGYLDRFEKAFPQLMRKKLRVEAMTNDELTDVLTGINNYKNSNVSFKTEELEEISEAIFNKLKGDTKTLTIDLPYLQIFLDKLYVDITHDKTHQTEALISKADVLNIKNIETVLADFMEEEVEIISGELSAGNKSISPDTIWKILSPFATLEGTKEPIKRVEYQNRIKNNDITTELVDDCFSRFTERRILNYSENTERFELAHDSLAKYIAGKRSPEEIKLLEVGRIINHQVAIKAGARELFTPRQLNIIRPSLDKLNLTAEENKLIEESADAQKKKLRNSYAKKGISLALLLVVALVVNWFSQRREANNIRLAGLAKYKKLAAKSIQDEKLLTPFLYITEALALQKDSLQYDSLVTVAKDNNLFPAYPLEKYLQDTSKVIYAAFGPGDKTVYAWTDNGILTEWDLATENKIRIAMVKYDTSGNDETVISYRFPVFSQPNSADIVTHDTMVVRDSSNYFKKMYIRDVVIDTDKAGLPNFPAIILKLNGAFFNDERNKVITWGKNTESIYDAADLWDHDGIPIGTSLIHDGIKGAKMNADNSLVLTWGIDSTLRIWKYNKDSGIYDLPPALIKLKARLETGVEISTADNSIKIIDVPDYNRRKQEFLRLLKQYEGKKK